MNNKELESLFSKQEIALVVLRDKFNTIYNQDNDNSIMYINYRLKSIDSTKKKLTTKLNLEYTIKNIEENIFDITGIRIICPFLKDIETVINYIKEEKDIEIINEKDYITNPKESGYMSYHMQVRVPININNTCEYVNAEIQIRTLAMDTILSLEHKIVYKNDINLSTAVSNNLKNTIYFMNNIDNMLNVYSSNKKVKLSLALEVPSDIKQQLRNFINSLSNNYPKSGIYNPIMHTKIHLNNEIPIIKVVSSFISSKEDIINDIINNDKLIFLERIDNDMGTNLLVKVPIIIDNNTVYLDTIINVKTSIMNFYNNLQEIIELEKDSNLLNKLYAIDYSLDVSANTIKENNKPRKKKLIKGN